MDRKDVPQDSNATLNGARKVVYAVDEDGQYKIVPTTGWVVEEVMTSMAVDHYLELAQMALSRVKQGEVSSLEYHMYASRFNIATLAQATEQFQWRVRRHLKQPIEKMKPKTLHLYAEALGMEVGDLFEIP